MVIQCDCTLWLNGVFSTVVAQGGYTQLLLTMVLYCGYTMWLCTMVVGCKSGFTAWLFRVVNKWRYTGELCQFSN